MENTKRVFEAIGRIKGLKKHTQAMADKLDELLNMPEGDEENAAEDKAEGGVEEPGEPKVASMDDLHKAADKEFAKKSKK
jgi:hypothetical protein